MSVLRFASFNLHELIKLKHTPFAAAVPFAALVEDGHARMVDALFAPSALPLLICSATGPSAANSAIRNIKAVVVRVGLWFWRWWRWCILRDSDRLSCGWVFIQLRRWRRLGSVVRGRFFL